MVENPRSRATAEAAFLKTQTQSLARNRMQSETEASNQARDANTARLKALRLNRDAMELASTASAAPSGKTRKGKEPV